VYASPLTAHTTASNGGSPGKVTRTRSPTAKWAGAPASPAPAAALPAAPAGGGEAAGGAGSSRTIGETRAMPPEKPNRAGAQPPPPLWVSACGDSTTLLSYGARSTAAGALEKQQSMVEAIEARRAKKKK